MAAPSRRGCGTATCTLPSGLFVANASTSVLFSFGSYLLFTRVFGAQLAAGILPF